MQDLVTDEDAEDPEDEQDDYTDEQDSGTGSEVVLALCGFERGEKNQSRALISSSCLLKKHYGKHNLNLVVA